MRTRATLAFVATILFSLSAHAAAKAGKYTVTTTSVVEGKTFTQTTPFCLRQEHIDHPEKFAEGLSSHGCTISSFKAENGVFSWSASCVGRSGAKVETKGTYTFHTDSFEGRQEIIRADGTKWTLDQKAVWAGSQCDAMK